MKNYKPSNEELSQCNHENKKQDGDLLLCQDCGLILEEGITFGDYTPISPIYKETQRDYERSIRNKDSKAMQNPSIKQKYDKIKTLETWYKDVETSFGKQKQTIGLLKSYGIGLNVDKIKYQDIKKRYLSYYKKHRITYQNTVIIFLAIIWLEIKETTNTRVERYIEVCSELGHKINKKMINRALLKIKKTENLWGKKISSIEIENEIKDRIKMLFQKDLNGIPLESVKEQVEHESKYEKIKIQMQLLASEFIDRMPYQKLRNLNYKAFTAGLIYYVGQSIYNRKIFTQTLVEKSTKFSSTTIRKKYNLLKEILGDPQQIIV